MLCDQTKIFDVEDNDTDSNFYSTRSNGEEFSSSAGGPTIARLTDAELHKYVGECKRYLQEFANNGWDQTKKR